MPAKPGIQQPLELANDASRCSQQSLRITGSSAFADNDAQSVDDDTESIRPPMIRPVLTEVALFLAPFVIYAIFLMATRAGVVDPKSWTLQRLGWLLIAALLLMVGSFVVLAQWGGARPGSTYVPAHFEDGRFVPGQTK